MFLKVKNVPIPSGTALGASFIGDGKLVAIQMPAAWDAAVLTFQGSMDGVTYANMYDSLGNEVNIPAAASEYIRIADMKALWIKVRSGTSGAPVNQSADRLLLLLVHKDPFGTL